MKFRLALLLLIITYCKAFAIQVYIDDSLTIFRGDLHKFQINSIHIVTPDGMVNELSNYEVFVSNTNVSKSGPYFEFYSVADSVTIALHDIKRDTTFVHTFITEMPPITVFAGYIPARRHGEISRGTRHVYIENTYFTLISCHVSVTDSTGKKLMFEEDITNGQINNWDDFNNALFYNSKIIIDDIIVTNKNNDTFKLPRGMFYNVL